MWQDYEVLEEIGAGASGVVYRARHRGLGRMVALKVLRSPEAGPGEAERFRREAELAANLDHPHIAPVYELGEHEGRLFYSMKLIEGTPLSRAAAALRGDWKRLSAMLAVVARALHHAHEKGVLHRDLKPANIVLDAAGQPYLVDFGLARSAQTGQSLTATGVILGTPGYLAPEQAAGRKDLSRAVDLWALGGALYELLTGRLPFSGPTPYATLLAIQTQRPVPPRTINREVPPDLQAICLCCLEKAPADRYPTAEALAEDLERFSRGERVRPQPRRWKRFVGRQGARVRSVLLPVLTWPAHRVERAVQWGKRNPLSAGAVAAVVVLLGAVVWLSSSVIDASSRARQEAAQAQQAEAQAKQAEARTKEALHQKGEAQQREREARLEQNKAELLTYASRLRQAQIEIDRRRLPEAQAILVRCPPHLRCWEHDYLMRQAQRCLWTDGNQTRAIYNVAFSPDGKRIVAGGLGGSVKSERQPGVVRVWCADTGRVQHTLRGPGYSIHSVAFSPDGKLLLTGSDHMVRVWGADTGREQLTLKGHTNYAHSAAYSPDGKRIASGSKDNTVRVWDAETGLVKFTLKGHTGAVWSVAFSPDGKRLVSGAGEAKVWDTDTGREQLTLRGHTGAVRSVAFSPDGKTVLTGSGKLVKVWSASTGQLTHTLQGHTGDVLCVAFRPDGKRIVSGSGIVQQYPRGAVELQEWSLETGQQVRSLLRGPTGIVYSLAFSPDGKRVVSGDADGTVKMWDAETGPGTIPGITAAQGPVAFSPDGKRLVTGSGDNLAKVWDAQTGREQLTLKGHPGPVRSVAFSPDGRRIVTGGNVGPGKLEQVKVWDAQTGAEQLALRGHPGYVFSVAFSPDGKRIVAGGTGLSPDDAVVKVWSAEKGQELLTLKGHRGIVYSVAFSPDGKRIASGGLDRTLKVWDADSGKELLSLSGHKNTVNSVAFSPDGKRLLSGSEDRTVKVWDVDTGREQLTLKGHTGSVHGVAFTPDGKRIVSTAWSSPEGAMKVWDAVWGLDLLTLESAPNGILSMALSPDGKRIASFSADKTVKVWDGSPGRGPHTFKGHAGLVGNYAVSRVTFSPDGKRIVASAGPTVKVWDADWGLEALTLEDVGGGHATFSPDSRRIVFVVGKGTVKTWDLDTGQVAVLLEGHTEGVSNVAFSADCKRIAFGCADQSVKVWDAGTGRMAVIRTGHTIRVYSVALSSDGKRLVSTGWQELKVWDVETGREVFTLKGRALPISSPTFSPDGTRIASGGVLEQLEKDGGRLMGVVKVWDTDTGQEKLTLKGHTGEVRSVAFSPDGQRIVSASVASSEPDKKSNVLSGEVKVWDAQTQKELLTLQGHMGGVHSVAFSPDGQRIVACSDGYVVRVWEVNPGR